MVNDAATILTIQEVPILCYHQVRDWRPTDSRLLKPISFRKTHFVNRSKMLADSGYHAILPDQLSIISRRERKLPSKPVMLTFDDTDLDQYTVAWP